MSTSISDTVATLNKLIETCKDGQEGFRLAAEAIAGDEDLKGFLFSCSLQRSKFAGELQNELLNMGETGPADSGRVAAALHRGWIGLKSVLTHRDNHAILAECERGEDVAVADYRKAVESNLSDPLVELVNRQFQEVLASHNTVRGLRDGLAAKKRSVGEFAHDVSASVQEKGRALGASAADGWAQTRSSTVNFLEEAEIYIRENPLPAIVAAAGLGLAVGLLVRSSERPARRDRIEVPIPKAVQHARDFDYRAAVLPFLWPVVKFFTKGYASSRKTVEKAYNDARGVDVSKYVDPVVKRARKFL